MNKKGWFEALFFALFCLGVILFIIFSITGLHIKTTENGRHTGYVTAIETNGWIFKTHSVYFKSDTESTQEDRYCILDENLMSELRIYQENQTMVTIEFYDVMFYGVKNCKSSDIAVISGVKA